jgi:predicted MPP superfamily phosphohydrolase
MFASPQVDPASTTPGPGRARRRPRRPPPLPVLAEHEVVVAGLDPRHDGVRVAHLSDIHVGNMTPAGHVRAAIALASGAGADLIVMTGDYVCWRRHEVEAAREQLAGLRAPRVLTVLGNHDYFTHARGMTAALVDQGYEVLRNQHTVIELRGAPLTVVGIDDPVTRHHDVEAAFAGVARRAGSLVLCHAPDAAPGLARAGAGLVLSGHTHGGQIYVPGVTDRIMRRLGLNYRGGHYAVGDTTALYVTPGVGFSGVTHRVGPGTAAEVALLTLRAPRATAPAGTARSAGATAAAG